MTHHQKSSLAIDFILVGIALGTITGTMLIAPNAVQLLEKPLDMLGRKLDARARERQLIQWRSYLKTQGLISGNYSHGIELTKKALKRVQSQHYKNLSIDKPDRWDGKWRLVLFDIPERHRGARIGFMRKMRSLGFQHLQRSVWVYPFTCKETAFIVASHYHVERWVTYIETDSIDNDTELRRRFSV